MRTAARHVRTNAVAYLALFVALGGTSYAAVSLPSNSVGNRQLRNHSIDPDKLNPKFIRGSIRIWASVTASGRVVAGGRGVKVVPPDGVAEKSIYELEPAPGGRIATPRRCAPVVSVDDNASAGGYATAEVGVFSRSTSPRWQVVVETYGADGLPAPLPFDLAVVC
jgi:hypothetical protein